MKWLLLIGLATTPLFPAAPSSGCGACHQNEANSQPKTAMAQALEPAAACDILKAHPELTFQAPPYSYRITRKGDTSTYTVTDGKETLTVPLTWAFGLGAAGQTYLYQRNGNWYESRVSYFRSIGRLDYTLGAGGSTPASLEEAAGRYMTIKDSTECFGCHSTASPGLQAGVHCERCHTGSDKHLASFQSKPSLAGMAKLTKASTDEISDLCGQCHRTWAKIASEGPFGINNVRFQPYRLTNSKCYDPVDRRISCTGCHDPHRDVVRQIAAYDAKCQACHASGKSCPVAKSGCAGCHMPKLELPGSHNQFTDHQIRIVRANEKYPN